MTGGRFDSPESISEFVKGKGIKPFISAWGCLPWCDANCEHFQGDLMRGDCRCKLIPGQLVPIPQGTRMRLPFTVFGAMCLPYLENVIPRLMQSSLHFPMWGKPSKETETE
jgi:hypothetical protein